MANSETTINGSYIQVLYNPESDDLAAILSAHPMDVLLSEVAVTPTQIVLHIGPPPLTPLFSWPAYVPSVFPVTHWGPSG